MFVPYGDRPIQNPPDHALIPHLLAYTSLQKAKQQKKDKFASDIKKGSDDLKFKHTKREVATWANDKYLQRKTVQVRKGGPSIKLMKTQE